MALLQIAEPGQSSVPHQQKSAIGIDLGTTYSLVAVPGPNGPTVLPDENQRVLLPSVVEYLPARTLVGYEALEGRLTNPRNTIVSVKRFMGRGLADVAHVETMPYDFMDSDGMVRLQTSQGAKSPVEVSAEILKNLYQRAQQHVGSNIVGAVITVPAYFDDAQRQATKDAARLAGLHVLRLLNEPTAAAVAYGLDNSIEGLYAVFDLGGGTFDISILRLTRGVFEVLATGGDTSLGGDDFDQRLYCHLLDTLKLPPLDSGDSACLLMEARRIKEKLTTHQTVDFQIPFVGRPQSNGTIDRETFSAITRTLVDKSLATVRQTLRSVRLSTTDIQGVVMVGGASRMPHVQQAVGDMFGRAPINNLDPDQVVALGAARQAGLLVGQREDGQSWILLDVVPLSLGVETMGGLVEKIVPRHATLPVARSQEFTTAQDGQTAMSIHIVQGERELVNDCRSLGQFTLTGLPPLPAGTAKVKVVFQVDADSLLSVTAQEQTTGVEAGIQVKPSYGLSEDHIKEMLQDSLRHSQEDMQFRQQREEMVEAERLLHVVHAALRKDAALLEKAEHEIIADAVTRLEQMLAAQSPHIKEAREKLERVTHDFAVRRMNHSIQSIMSGRRIEEFT